MTIRLVLLAIIGIFAVSIIAIYLFKPELLRKYAATQRVRNNNPIGKYVGLGIVFGMLIGSAMDNVGTGLALGIIFGACIGSVIKMKQKKDNV